MVALTKANAVLRSPIAPLVAAALLLSGDYLLASLGHPVPCLFRHLTGIPCPTCGSTRAGLDLLRLDLAGALRQNPLVTGAYLALPVLAALRAARVRLPAIRTRVAVPVLLAAVAANWVYVLCLGPR